MDTQNKNETNEAQCIETLPLIFVKSMIIKYLIEREPELSKNWSEPNIIFGQGLTAEVQIFDKNKNRLGKYLFEREKVDAIIIDHLSKQCTEKEKDIYEYSTDVKVPFEVQVFRRVRK